MKTFAAFLLVLIFADPAFSQKEFYGAGMAGDTLKVWNTNISSSCGSSWTASVVLTNDSITVTEQDTSTRHATCTCFYDIQASISGLSEGKYQVVILRKRPYPKDTLVLIGSFTVDVPKINPLLPGAKIQASDCHQTPDYVDEMPFVNTFALLTCYPNPFNPVATIRYSLPQAMHVTLDIYDAMGKVVGVIVDEKKSAGSYETQFDGTNFASGIYFCRLAAGSRVITTKLVLLK